MDWRKAKQDRQQRKHGTEQANPKSERLAGPHTHIKRAPVKTWADMTEEELEAVRRGLGQGKGGKHRPSPP